MAMLDPTDVAPEVPRRFSRAEYDRMAETGLFEDERVELLHGVIVSMSPIGPPHASTVDLLAEVFVLAVSGKARVRVQGSFAASDDSQPEPDLALYPPGDYDRDHPTDAWLIVEVAQSSLAKDRGLKARLYAASKVEEYWIVNLQDRCVEVCFDSDGDRFTKSERYVAGESVRLQHFPAVTIDVGRFLT